MPTHPILGEYFVDESGDIEFDPIEIEDEEIERIIYASSPVPQANFDALCQLFVQAETLAKTAKDHIVTNWNNEFLEMVEDWVDSNPDMEILEELFPGAGVASVDDITQDLVAKSIHVINMMGGYDEGQGHTFTIDVKCKDGDFDQFLAVRFDDAGTVIGVDEES